MLAALLAGLVLAALLAGFVLATLLLLTTLLAALLVWFIWMIHLRVPLLVEDYRRYSPRFGYFVTLELTAVSCGDTIFTIFTGTPPVDRPDRPLEKIIGILTK